MSSLVSCAPEWAVERDGPVAELRLTGDWIACEAGVPSAAEVVCILDQAGARTLRIDARSLGRWDSALVAFLKMLRDFAATEQTQTVRVDYSGIPDAALKLLALASADPTEAANAETAHSSLTTQIGKGYFRVWSGTVEVAALVGGTALRGAAAFAGRTRTRAVDVLEFVSDAGVGALGIVAVVNGLVGAILAFVGAIQFERFGAGIYVANLVGIAVAREMAAMVTAIVMAGRTGGAYAAQLATMQGNEEIDALNTLGIPIVDFLVLPRVAALVTMMPLLYLYGCVAGLFGGFVVGVATLDITPVTFLEQLRRAVSETEFAIGLVKSVAFGALIALAGCHIGLKAGRSAADVGRAATAAVVAGIVGVIALDAVFALCANALGI